MINIYLFCIPIGGIGMDDEKKKIVDRLKRIEGQVRGLQRLIEEDVSCADILIQVSAVHSAMKKAGGAIIAAHMNKCLGKSDHGSEYDVNDFQRALMRFIDLA